MPENGQKKEQEKPQLPAVRDPRLSIPVIGGGLAPRDYGELVEFAKMVSASGMVPKSYTGNTGAVLVAVQMGAELGLSPMAAIRSICVINGMPSVWGDGLLALVVSHPECEDVIEEISGGVATCTVKRRGRSPVVRVFSYDDAKRAGLDKKQGPWQQYPQRMLQMRARSWACRDAFPDVLRGVRSTEEAMDSVDMGPAEYLEPQPGPQINPATAVPKPGVSHFGRGRENGPGATQPQGPEQEPAPGPEKPPAVEDGASSPGKYDGVGPGAWDEGEQQPEPEQESLGF